MKVQYIFISSILIVVFLSADLGASGAATGDAFKSTGPIAGQAGVDEQWDLVFWNPCSGEAQMLGCEFAGGCFYLAGCITPGYPEVWVLDTTGVLLFSFAQWTTGWGWHDLAYDGQYLYGASDYIVHAFDLEGNPVPELNISAPVLARALAYDQNTDTFWGGNWTSPLVNFDRDGNVIWESGPGGPSIAGLAYDDFAPNGPWLWIHSQEGGCTLYQFDPYYHVYTGFTYQVPMMPGLTSQIAGGLAFTEEYCPEYSVMIGLIQGIPYDGIYGLEMYPNPPPNVAISLIPYGGPPIVIPPTGGNFDYNVEVNNNEPSQVSFDAWIMVYLPDGSLYGPVAGPVDFTLPGGWSISRERTQQVPGGAPSGIYTYVGYVGYYPGVIADSSFFTFEKSAYPLGGSSLGAWDIGGEFLEGNTEPAIADEHAVITNYPNPFNPVTNISYTLPAAGLSNLSVFDVQGRLVAELFSGWQNAGQHKVAFDASHLTSGIYVYRLEAGQFTASGKMVLMK